MNDRDKTHLIAALIFIVMLLIGALIFVGTMKLAERNRNEFAESFASLNTKIDSLKPVAPKDGMDGVSPPPPKNGKDGQAVKGPKGDTGSAGLTAYEIWLSEGHTGSKKDFLASLRGKDGKNGRTPELAVNTENKTVWRYTGDTLWSVLECKLLCEAP